MRVLVAILSAVLMTPGSAPAQLASSTFDTGADGWTLVGDTTSSTPAWSATGGNPGGFIRGTDSQWGITWYFNAPAEFLGDRSAAYGGVLRFDLRQSVDQLFNHLIGQSDNFRLRVTPASGGLRVIAFGSRVANGSQDATTFEMTYPPGR